MKKGLIWVIAVSLFLVFGLTGCSSTSGGQGSSKGKAANNAQNVTLKIWLMGSGKGTKGDYYKKVFKKFESQNPGIKVNYQFISWSNAHQQLVTAIQGGSTPDIAEMGSTWNPEFSATGGLADMDQLVNKMGIKDDFVPALKKAGTYRGKLYGVPWYAGVRQILYNKKLFKKAGVQPPKTYKDVLKVGKIIKNKTGKYAWPAVGTNIHILLPMVWAYGGEIAVKQKDQNGNLKWVSQMNQPPAVQAFKTFAQVYKDKLVPSGAAMWGSKEALQAFAQGDLAMIENLPFAIQSTLSKNPKMKGNIGVAPLPNHNIGFVGGSNLVVFKQSKEKQAADKLVKFLIQKGPQLQLAKTAGVFPGRKSILNDSYYQKNPVLSKYVKALKVGRTYPPAPTWGQIEGLHLVEKAIQSIMLGKEQVKPALNELTQNMNKAFSSGP